MTLSIQGMNRSCFTTNRLYTCSANRWAQADDRSEVTHWYSSLFHLWYWAVVCFFFPLFNLRQLSFSRCSFFHLLWADWTCLHMEHTDRHLSDVAIRALAHIVCVSPTGPDLGSWGLRVERDWQFNTHTLVVTAAKEVLCVSVCVLVSLSWYLWTKIHCCLWVSRVRCLLAGQTSTTLQDRLWALWHIWHWNISWHSDLNCQISMMQGGKLGRVFHQLPRQSV